MLHATIMFMLDKAHSEREGYFNSPVKPARSYPQDASTLIREKRIVWICQWSPTFMYVS